MMLKMDKDTHTYDIDGRRAPSVTQVLADLLPGWQADAWYLQRGTAVHACAAMIARDESFSYDPQIAGQVANIRRFFSEIQPEIIAVELPVCHVRHRYAGTLDLVARIKGQIVVIDWKSSVSHSAPYQLAAYALAYDAQNKIQCGYAVAITTKTYRIHQYDLREYRAGWLALLNAYHIRRKCGISGE